MFKKILLVFIIVLLIIAIITAIFVYNKMNKINYVPLDMDKIEITESVKEELKSYRNILIFGLDDRTDSYDDRTDCIMIASLNEQTNEVKLVSVYRDTYLNIEGYGLDKVNHAHLFGGTELSISTLNLNLDLNITDFVAINFFAMQNVVDYVGGVDIDITADELKYINGYINAINSYESTAYYASNITSTGLQTLNGIQSLAYSRIRYTEGWDWKRTERMRTVLLKVFEKTKNMGVAELNTFIDYMLPQVQTNITSTEILSVLPKINTYKVVKQLGWPYEVQAYEVYGPWYGVAVNLESNVSRLHKELFDKDDYVPSDYVKNIGKIITEKTGI